MLRHIALALAIAAISTIAAAQSGRKQPTWDDLFKPYEAKTNPAIPVAPSSLPTEIAIETASPGETETLGKVKDLAGILLAYNECKREFVERGQQAIKDCILTVIKRRDSEKIDSVDRRTR